MDIISSKLRESYLHHSAIDENMVMFGYSSSESVVVGALAFVINETIAEPAKVESEKIEIFSPPTFSGRSFMVQHLLHIRNLVTPEIWYNIRRFRRLVSPLGASGSGFGIFQPPPVKDAEREKSATPFSCLSDRNAKNAPKTCAGLSQSPPRCTVPVHLRPAKVSAMLM